MARPRSGHSAILQPDGRVLVIGGTGPNGRTDDAELWDPANSSFTAVPPMRHPRGLGATVAAFPDGRALVVGGASRDQDHPGQVVAAEVWDPASGTFRDAGRLPWRPNRVQILPLADGGALVVGRPGRDWLRWDPDRRQFERAGQPSQQRDHVFGLNGGRVLAVGITDPIDCRQGPSDAATPDAEVWLPLRGTFRAAGAFGTPRGAASVTALPDGGALFYGGGNALCFDVAYYRTAEHWDPRTRRFSPAGHTRRGRDEHTATLLPDGRVAFIGGRVQRMPQPEGVVTAAVEVWDPVTRSFSAAGRLLEPRTGHTAVLLLDGSVLVMGGTDADERALDTAELWVPPPMTD
jgi:hypothetical protein